MSDDVIVIVRMPERVRQYLEDIAGCDLDSPKLREAWEWLRGEHEESEQ